MIKHIGNGLLLGVQFFSVFPVKKELPLQKNDVTSMYGSLPLLGALFGIVVAASLWLLRDFTDANSLLIAFIVVAMGFALTGGLHLDGMADAGDAYFSYQDREKRLRIMEDPRIGAFGTMVLIFTIIGKIIIVAEIAQAVPISIVAVIPVLARIGLMILFSTTASAKEKGLAAFFQRKVNFKIIWIAAGLFLLVALGVMVYAVGWWTAASMVIILMGALVIYRRWCIRNFGGVTGDLFGAYVEGAEVVLWTALLFFI